MRFQYSYYKYSDFCLLPLVEHSALTRISFQDWRPFFNPCSCSIISCTGFRFCRQIFCCKFKHLSACLHAHTALILLDYIGCYTTILFVYVASVLSACFAYPIAPFPVTRGFNGQDLHFEKCLGRGYFGEASEVIESKIL